ncbi:telomere length regulation protein TEL2 homolog isoform X1 [Haliotis rufescens]|uniref:telomere length regulation protein TEL2 homolog isoform X1 n=1 Tax=Haliotis rufescens TaxID=6454 RepID=UPI001EAFD6CB|nr:telomere length regulation protein TEL2 homolog isoform X1 [Haliotis rufescens]
MVEKTFINVPTLKEMENLEQRPLLSEIRRMAREIENGLSCDKISHNYIEMLMKFREFVCDTEFSHLKHMEGISSSDLASARSIFRQYHYSRCCSRLLNSLSVEVVSKYSKAAVQSLESIFRNGPATQAIIVLCTTISKSGLGFKLHKCVSLLETLLTDHKLAEIFWEQSVMNPSMPECNDSLIQDQLTTTIVSLPETVTNKLQKETGEMFYPQSYVPLVCGDIYMTLEKVQGCLVAGSDCSLEFVSKVLGRLALAGHADRVWGCLLPQLYTKVHSDYVWCRICERVITGVPTRCLESVLTPFLKQLPWYGLAGRFLGDSVVKNHTIQNLLCTKLLFHRHFSQILVVQNIIGYLATSHTRRKLYLKVFLSLLEVWGDASSVKHTAYEQHRYISQAVLICVGHLNSQEKEAYKDEFVRLLMPGVSCHIGHSDPKMRRLGMTVAENLTRQVDQGGPQLNFQSECDAEIDALLAATAVPEEPNVDALDRMLGKTVISESTPLPAAVPREAPQPSQSGLGEDSDLDSDDDLQAFDMSHDVVRTKVKVPKYVRDCMDGLISTDDVDRVDVCLQEAETLIRRNPDGLQEIAAEFTKVLLHLSDGASYRGFITRRSAAMVALTVQCPRTVADYLTQEFYERNYNLRQRMDILEVLVAAAKELSKPSPPSTQAAHRKVEEIQSSSQADSATWREIVEKRIESKTRRFARGRSQPLPQPMPNMFAPVAGHFFYPLMKNFDRKENTFDLLGEDTLVLGRLVYSLGMILYAALHVPASGQMGSSLLEFTWGLRFHSDVFVRQAVLFATSMIILVVPCHSLISDLNAEVTEMKLWLEGVMERDPDCECRELALQALVLLGNVMRQEFHVETPVT